MLTWTLSSLWARKRRALGAGLAVLIGVAFLTATTVLGDAMTRGIDALFVEGYSATDAEVRSSHQIETEGLHYVAIDASLTERLAALPEVGAAIPMAEGTAQYQRTALDYDQWDTHRDMLLRTRVLAGREMTLTEMGGFYSHTSLLREGVYNHGYAFTRYIAGTYGEDALRSISENLGRWSNWNFYFVIWSDW